MDNFNRTISFILGLVVVIVFLAVISGRINLRNRLSSLTKSSTPSPSKISPTPTSQKIISQISVPPSNLNYQTNLYQNQMKQTNPQSNLKTIPGTGSPTVLLLLTFSSLIFGVGIKRKVT